MSRACERGRFVPHQNYHDLECTMDYLTARHVSDAAGHRDSAAALSEECTQTDGVDVSDECMQTDVDVSWQGGESLVSIRDSFSQTLDPGAVGGGTSCMTTVDGWSQTELESAAPPNSVQMCEAGTNTEQLNVCVNNFLSVRKMYVYNSS